MNYFVSVIRADPWVFFGVLVGLSSVVGSMTKGAGFFKSLIAQVLVAGVAFGITAGVGAYGDGIEAKAKRQFNNTTLEGSFSGSGDKLGDWTVTPSGCLDGKERGFEGILFVFEDGPVKELRVDTSRKKHNTISVHLDDAKASVVQLRERDCKVIDGERHVSSRTLNGRNMRRLRGHVRIVCPGLEGQAKFDGCLPETLDGR
jgi:hypothetical protein